MRRLRRTALWTGTSFRHLRHASAPAAVFWIGVVVFLPGLTQCSETCFDYDEQGNRFTFECETCVEQDSNPCTVDSWRLPPGSVCDLSQQPLEDDGTPCDASGAPGACLNGACDPVPYLAAGSGSSTWLAATTPPGGGVTVGVTGGCAVYFSTIAAFVHFDTEITMHATSDGLGNVSVGYDLSLQNPLLPTISIAEYGGVSLGTTMTNATPAAVTNTADPSAVGQTIVPFLVPPTTGTELLFSTSGGTITEETITVIPTSPGNVNINFSGQFSLDFTLEANPLFQITEADCTFDAPGTGVDFAVVEP